MPKRFDFTLAPTGEPDIKFTGERIAHCEGRYADANHRFKDEQVNIYLTQGGRYVAERIMNRGSDYEALVRDFGDKSEIPDFLGYSDAAKQAYAIIGLESARFIE